MSVFHSKNVIIYYWHINRCQHLVRIVCRLSKPTDFCFCSNNYIYVWFLPWDCGRLFCIMVNTLHSRLIKIIITITIWFNYNYLHLWVIVRLLHLVIFCQWMPSVHLAVSWASLKSLVTSLNCRSFNLCTW